MTTLVHPTILVIEPYHIYQERWTELSVQVMKGGAGTVRRSNKSTHTLFSSLRLSLKNSMQKLSIYFHSCWLFINKENSLTFHTEYGLNVCSQRSRIVTGSCGVAVIIVTVRLSPKPGKGKEPSPPIRIHLPYAIRPNRTRNAKSNTENYHIIIPCYKNITITKATGTH